MLSKVITHALHFSFCSNLKAISLTQAKTQLYRRNYVTVLISCFVEHRYLTISNKTATERATQ